MSARGWRTSEPGPRRPPEEPALITEAVALPSANGISLDQLADAGHLTGSDDLAERLRLNVRPRLRVAI